MSTCTKSVRTTVWLLLLSEKHNQAVAAGAHTDAILHTSQYHHHVPHQEWQWVNVLPPRRDATALSEMLMARKNVPHSLQNATLPNSFTQEKLYCECLMPDTWDDMVMCDVCDMWFHLKCAGLQITSSIGKNSWYVKSICKVKVVFTVCVYAPSCFLMLYLLKIIVCSVCMLLLFSLILYHLHLIILLLYHQC